METVRVRVGERSYPVMVGPGAVGGTGTLIRDRLDSHRGYHYQVVTIDGKSCFECHNDHAGRDFELVHWPDGRSERFGPLSVNRYHQLRQGGGQRPESAGQ